MPLEDKSVCVWDASTGRRWLGSILVRTIGLLHGESLVCGYGWAASPELGGDGGEGSIRVSQRGHSLELSERPRSGSSH